MINQFQKSEMIVQPTKADVLCGRGKDCFHHEGNHQFRALIGEHADTYKMAPTKKQKMEVIMLIADIIIARGGRFLVQLERDGSWNDGGKRVGKKKVGHALRDALRGRVKCMSKILANNRRAEHSDDWSDTRSDHSDESHLESNDISSIPDLLMVEPSKDWMNQEMDSAVADDLLTFFLTEY